MVLNGFLRGAKKTEVDAVLSVIWMGLLLVGWYISGWQTAVTGIALSFIAAIAFDLARLMLRSPRVIARGRA